MQHISRKRREVSFVDPSRKSSDGMDDALGVTDQVSTLKHASFWWFILSFYKTFDYIQMGTWMLEN